MAKTFKTSVVPRPSKVRFVLWCLLIAIAISCLGSVFLQQKFYVVVLIASLLGAHWILPYRRVSAAVDPLKKSIFGFLYVLGIAGTISVGFYLLLRETSGGEALLDKIIFLLLGNPLFLFFYWLIAVGDKWRMEYLR